MHADSGNGIECQVTCGASASVGACPGIGGFEPEAWQQAGRTLHPKVPHHGKSAKDAEMWNSVQRPRYGCRGLRALDKLILKEALEGNC